MVSTTRAYVQVKNKYYCQAAEFIFNGTDLLGVISKIKVSYKVQNSSSPGSIRIYDCTNTQTIATKTGLTSTQQIIVDLGSLSNLPKTASIFELQMKTTSNGRWIRASSLTMEF